MTELGRVDILTELSMLSTHQASSHQGHMNQLYHIFAYVKHKLKLTIYFNEQLPQIDMSWFAHGDDPKIFWNQYHNALEEMPPKYLTPEPLGQPIMSVLYVDTSHAANKVTQQSHTGFIIFSEKIPNCLVQ